MKFNRTKILGSYTSDRHLQTRRGLYQEDIVLFTRLVRDNPHKTVRVYSAQGFVPNAYRYRVDIERITRNGKTGQISIDWGSAQRSHGSGPHCTVNNRGVSA